MLFDVSKSMSDKNRHGVSSAREVFKNTNSEDEYFGVGFSNRPHFLAGPSIFWLSDITYKTGGRAITVDNRAKLPKEWRVRELFSMPGWSSSSRAALRPTIMTAGKAP